MNMVIFNKERKEGGAGELLRRRSLNNEPAPKE
jgi:hypothetical protein